VSANVEGANLGEVPLDEFWAAAVALDAPVFLHPTQPNPTPRSRRYALNTIVQYTFDTTLAVGTLIGSGVLDRFPALRLILAHGGGAFPYLAGRFDCMFERSGIATAAPPSAYLDRLYYDTLLHDAPALRYLASRVGVDRLVIGTDDGFPPADRDPLGSLRRAGFKEEEIHRIAETTPRGLFSRLT
jgi:aminocarboxymuconate-semialdehyde decarboxylase